MDALIELLFSNAAIIALVIGGIISWINRMNSEKEKSQRDRSAKPQRSASKPVLPERGQVQRAETASSRPENGNKMKKYYQEKQRHLKDISDQEIGEYQQSETFTYATPGRHIHDTQTGDMERIKPSQKGEKRITSSLSVRNKLTSKGIAESVMMAEVLGPPRAHKPHRSLRRNNY